MSRPWWYNDQNVNEAVHLILLRQNILGSECMTQYNLKSMPFGCALNKALRLLEPR